MRCNREVKPVTGGEAVHRFKPALLLAICGMLALGGCQTVGDQPAGTWSLFRQEQPVLVDHPATLGEEHFVRGDYGLAERYYRQAVELNPADVGSWFGLAAAYDQLKRFDLADRAYDQVLQLSGPTSQYLNNHGYSYFLRGDARKGASMMREARSLDPIDPVITNNLVLVRTGRPPF